MLSREIRQDGWVTMSPLNPKSRVVNAAALSGSAARIPSTTWMGVSISGSERTATASQAMSVVFSTLGCQPGRFRLMADDAFALDELDSLTPFT